MKQIIYKYRVFVTLGLILCFSTSHLHSQVDKQNLLKEVVKFFDVLPKEVVYRNDGLEKVLVEEYDEFSNLVSSYQFDPKTGKRNGPFLDKPLRFLYSKGFRNSPDNFDFENHTNEGLYDQGIMTCNDCIYFLNKEIFFQGNVINGHLDGLITFYEIGEKKIDVKDSYSEALYRKTFPELSLYHGFDVNWTIEVGIGEFSKNKIGSVEYINGKVKDGSYNLNPLTTIFYENGILEGVIRKNENNHLITKDSLFRTNSTWKTENKFSKGTTHYFGPSFDPIDFYSNYKNANDLKIIPTDGFDKDNPSIKSNNFIKENDFYNPKRSERKYIFFSDIGMKYQFKDRSFDNFFLGIDYLRKTKVNNDGLFLENDTSLIEELYPIIKGGIYFFAQSFQGSDVESFPLLGSLNPYDYDNKDYINSHGREKLFHVFKSENLINVMVPEPNNEVKVHFDSYRYGNFILEFFNVTNDVNILVFSNKRSNELESYFVEIEKVVNKPKVESLLANRENRFMELFEFRNLDDFKRNSCPPYSTISNFVDDYDLEYYGADAARFGKTRKELYNFFDIVGEWSEEILGKRLMQKEISFYLKVDKSGHLNLDKFFTTKVDRSGNTSLEDIELDKEFIELFSKMIRILSPRLLPAINRREYVELGRFWFSYYHYTDNWDHRDSGFELTEL